MTTAPPSVTVPPPARPVEATLAGRHVAVTGFTGFLAKVFVAMLLEHVPDVRVSLLVRPRGRLRPARVRVEKILDTSPVFRALRARHGAGFAEWLRGRVVPVDADVEKPGCELAPGALDGVEAIVHCAGLTDFEPDPPKALGTNVAGALHVGQLALRLGVPLVHVSTCYVAGVDPRTDGLREVPEALEPGVSPNGTRFDPNAEVRALQLALRALPEPEARLEAGLARGRALGWPNIYTYTKGLAEHLLAAQRGLALTIVRPAIVECARAFPFPGWNEGLNTAGPLAWLLSTAFRRFPTAPGHLFDVVPVDDVCRGLGAITAAALEGRAGGVFQLGSSDHRPLTFARAVELTGLGMRRWTRKGGGTPLDRALYRFLDPVPTPADDPGPLAVARVRRFVGRARGWLPHGWREEGERRLADADADLARVEKMLQLYRPFVHDHAWRFHSGRARALTASEPTFRFDVGDLDWCRYWVDVEYPGLRTWCIPLIDGGASPLDPPSDPPLRLEVAAPAPATAG